MTTRLALLPGLDGTGTLFDPLVACLPSDPAPLVVRYPRTCSAVTDYVRTAGVALSTGERWLLVAESFSGPIAIRLLADRPDLNVAGIIFCASFASPPRRALLTLLKCVPLRLIFRIHPPSRLIKALCLGTAADRRSIDLLRNALSEAGPDVLATRLRLLANLPKPSAMISVPCLYIRPTADRLVPELCVREIAQRAGQMEVSKVEGPHFILQAEPNRCAELIGAFLDSAATSTRLLNQT